MKDDEASAFLTSVRNRTTTMSATCHSFEVFALTESKLLDCMRQLSFSSFSGSPYIVMHRLREELEKQRSEDAFWALAYVDLWYCSNFSDLYWSELVRLDRRNIRFAIQSALYVWSSSGSDSSQALSALIKACSCECEARAFLEELSNREDCGGWVERVWSP